MSKRKWHDITRATGDPKDLPTRRSQYLVAFKGRKHCRGWWFNPDDKISVFMFRDSVIAWREMPKAYRPKPRKQKG